MAATFPTPCSAARSVYVTMLTFVIAVTLAYFHSSWIVWTFMLALMLFMFGPRHPRIFDEHVPLDRTRLALAVAAVVMFILCFTPAPTRANGAARAGEIAMPEIIQSAISHHREGIHVHDRAPRQLRSIREHGHQRLPHPLCGWSL